jgi:hypothetical protein
LGKVARACTVAEGSVDVCLLGIVQYPAATNDTLWARGTSVMTAAIAGALIGGTPGRTGLGVVCGEVVEDGNTGENCCWRRKATAWGRPGPCA